jgi:AmmeMemoRadiSam system protein A
MRKPFLIFFLLTLFITCIPQINYAQVNFITQKEEKTLLLLARTTLENHIKYKKVTFPEKEGFKITQNLKNKLGVFVTLTTRKGDHLRGCIGYIKGIKPLYEGVMDTTISAAISDHRFLKVVEKELSGLKLSISILSPLKRLDDPNKIIVGLHGLLIKKDFHQGVLLPQVAVDWDWDKWQFLKNLCYKAGLEENAWKENAELFCFTAQIIKED